MGKLKKQEAMQFLVSSHPQTSLRIKAADIPVVLRCEDTEFVETLRWHYRLFGERENLEGALVQIDISIVNRLSGDTLSEGLSFAKKTISFLSRQATGSYSISERKARLQLLNKNPVESLGNFLRNLYTILLLSGQGLVLHAAGILKEGRVYIFFGASGSGKTTIANLSSTCGVLSDDQVFLKVTGEGRFAAFALPYFGDLQRDLPGSGPFTVGGLFYLVKDKAVYLRKLPIYEAMAKLITTPNLPAGLIDFSGLLRKNQDLLRQMPGYALHFMPADSFWRCIDEYCRGLPK
ncbi:MAG: hypothetical protein ACOY3D_07600 [Candidatus Omnitrophota bacterium]